MIKCLDYWRKDSPHEGHLEKFAELHGEEKDEEEDRGDQEEKGTTEDEMAGWHHRLDGHEFG